MSSITRGSPHPILIAPRTDGVSTTAAAPPPGSGRLDGASFDPTPPLISPPDEGQPVTPRAAALPRPRPDRTALAGVRVLAVDDEPDSRQLVSRLLESAGAHVQTAPSAAEAIAAFDAAPPDVLVSDISMPHMDGYDLIRKIRNKPPESGGLTPAVALTAFARPEDRHRARAAGFDAYLTKPVDPADLIATISRAAKKMTR